MILPHSWHGGASDWVWNTNFSFFSQTEAAFAAAALRIAAGFFADSELICTSLSGVSP
jgi:hypothetical protein